MTPIIKICNFNKNAVVITDLTLDSEEYIPEDSNLHLYQYNKYKYSETCTINIIEKISTKDNNIVGTIFTEHCSYLDETYYTFKEDGWYIIHHLILPTVDWLEKLLSLKTSIPENIYVTDGIKIYRYLEEELREVASEVIASVNTENTTISRIDVDLFSIFNLNNCYINLCKQVFASINYKCKSITPPNTFNRDFIWMTINVLKYYIELDLLMEALRLLEEINYCGGICNESNMSNSQSHGCGCNK